MIDLTLKLTGNFTDDQGDTLGELIDYIRRYGIEFWYKNVLYFIDWYQKNNDGTTTWQFVTNLDSCGDIEEPEKTEFFIGDTNELITKFFETATMHDGVPLWKIFVDKKYKKYFGYQRGKTFE